MATKQQIKSAVWTLVFFSLVIFLSLWALGPVGH